MKNSNPLTWALLICWLVADALLAVLVAAAALAAALRSRPTQPITRPAAQPIARPAAQPITRPAAQPITRPAAQPITRPAALHPLIAAAEPVRDALAALPVVTLRRRARAAGLPRRLSAHGRKAALIDALAGCAVALA